MITLVSSFKKNSALLGGPGFGALFHLGRPIQIRDTYLRTVWAPVFEPFGRVHQKEAEGQGGLEGIAQFVGDQIDDALSISFNLRFPGQYYDAETDLHYNYFRDYDPSLGRYIQSDPIGVIGERSHGWRDVLAREEKMLPDSSFLTGGLNHLYGYANQSSIMNTDPYGLRPVPGAVSPSTKCNLLCLDEWIISNAQSAAACMALSAAAPSGPAALAVHAACKGSSLGTHFSLGACLSKCSYRQCEQ